ncbi:UDP-4-amino-4,6-dideoxy-N-acetyl-beta-L-altrosamine transaminase [Pseudoalteromonas sp. SR41-1]|uniref:UDP-4-amino-4, 6-dideoxy-N-acetyl-beta-L-altrosamine transaminase n=1 Tax=Pseudoalteromonas sp. SR41-1 TaxID=2760952 RepID=UPI001603BA33|nr:UDP-4-amino-4,6-dideoxy-N-acetyl-beta-L-altrosamine transaminase [Pseudoalteromonas sp. SR41-1]MBB1280814.1 UDP-4-amino-4,6-dideoxy-N-acetyl-beta-L-altrosamine transaminase [Pseudoalteromonas sp. SR41-1]
MNSYGKQTIGQTDIDAVVNCLTSDYLTQGPKVAEFEQAICHYTQANHAVAVNSATSALHIACLALNLTVHDIAWTVSNTFVASANCAKMCGASIDFVDINPDTGNISIEALTEKLVYAKQIQQLPKLIVVVHFAGQPCDLEAIYILGQHYGFAIIEDASHALGASYKNRKIGSCHFSDITIFSFHPVKMITTAEGGMALTNNAKLAKKLTLLSSHGIEPSPKTDTPWHYTQQCLGFNYRLSDIHAALGCSQIQYLDEWVQTRNKLARYYDKKFTGSLITPLKQSLDSVNSYHLYVVLLPQGTQRDLYLYLKSKNIGVQIHYIPVHTQPYYNDPIRKLKNTEQYYSCCITLPLYPRLSRTEQDTIVSEIFNFYSGLKSL